nr:MAG TPA_asm: large terminase [Caudoviricetes sp.]
MWDSKRIGVAVFPRQTGKDVAMSMQSVKRRLEVKKTTGVYVSLNNPMVRDILWQKTYIGESGDYLRMLQDNVPSELVKWSDTSMEGRFTNGSRMKLQGYFQSGQDANGVGTSFQDYAFTELALFTREDPIPRLQPILANPMEEKRLMVASTPRGKRRNPLWQLMESFKGSPDFQVIVRTIDDINEIMVKNGLEPVLSEAELEQNRDAYLRRFGNDRMFEQEYYCSFEEMDAAAVYGEAYMQMIRDKRIDTFNINPAYGVYISFDIGSAGKQSDATAWIAFQWYNGKLFIFDCGEGHGRALPEYIDILREKPYFNQIKQVVLPWDAEHHSAAVTTTPADMVRLKFPNVAVLAKSNKIWRLSGGRSDDYNQITDIQQTRMALYNTVIHEKNCQWLLECLENYKYEFSTKLQQWTERPLHDKYSHMMDALRYTVQATKELDFFGELQDQYQSVASGDYVDDWSGVW